MFRNRGEGDPADRLADALRPGRPRTGDGDIDLMASEVIDLTPRPRLPLDGLDGTAPGPTPAGAPRDFGL